MIYLATETTPRTLACDHCGVAVTQPVRLAAWLVDAWGLADLDGWYCDPRCAAMALGHACADEPDALPAAWIEETAKEEGEDDA